MSTCAKCGARNPNENTVCRSCGALLGVEVPSAEPVPAAVATVPGQADGAGSAPAGGEGDVPWRRVALFGAAAAAVLGVLWYLQLVFWPDLPPFLAFVTGWLIGEAVRMGAGGKRSRSMQWLAVGLTAVTSAIVLFVHLGWNDPAAFPQAFADWISKDWIAPAMVLFGLGYAYLTAGTRPRARPQPQAPAAGSEAGAPESGGDAARAAEPASDTEAAPGEPSAAAAAGLTCVRCQAKIPVGDALLVAGGFRRGQLAVCPKCVEELEAKFKAETEDIRLAPAVLSGLGAALVIGVGWYVGSRYADENVLPMLNVLGLVAGWVIPEVVRRGAGKKRGRSLQLISAGLTFLMIAAVQVAIALGNPNGLVAGLGVQLGNLLTVVIFLLGTFQAYTGPAPRRLMGVKQQAAS